MSGYERRSLIQNNPCYNERINRNSLVFRLNTEVSSGRSSLWRNRFQDDVIGKRNPELWQAGGESEATVTDLAMCRFSSHRHPCSRFTDRQSHKDASKCHVHDLTGI